MPFAVFVPVTHHLRLLVCAWSSTQWREFKDARHDLFVETGEELLLLGNGNAETLLLEDASS